MTDDLDRRISKATDGDIPAEVSELRERVLAWLEENDIKTTPFPTIECEVIRKAVRYEYMRALTRFVHLDTEWEEPKMPDHTMISHFGSCETCFYDLCGNNLGFLRVLAQDFDENEQARNNHALALRPDYISFTKILIAIADSNSPKATEAQSVLATLRAATNKEAAEGAADAHAYQVSTARLVADLLETDPTQKVLWRLRRSLYQQREQIVQDKDHFDHWDELLRSECGFPGGKDKKKVAAIYRAIWHGEKVKFERKNAKSMQAAIEHICNCGDCLTVFSSSNLELGWWKIILRFLVEKTAGAFGGQAEQAQKQLDKLERIFSLEGISLFVKGIEHLIEHPEMIERIPHDKSAHNLLGFLVELSRRYPQTRGDA